jgi:hypothetical protein
MSPGNREGRPGGGAAQMSQQKETPRNQLPTLYTWGAT